MYDWMSHSSSGTGFFSAHTHVEAIPKSMSGIKTKLPLLRSSLLSKLSSKSKQEEGLLWKLFPWLCLPPIIIL
jgi:hypothetical protein